MKRSTNLFLLFLLVSTGLFAGVPVASSNTTSRVYAQKTEIITFSTLPSRKGIEVRFKKGIAGKAIVVIYDSDKNMLRKDILSNAKLGKGYILTSLDNGDYTVEVTLDKLIVKKDIHVYMEGQAKTFIIKS